jgi:inhibitor of cysteine peptidase
MKKAIIIVLATGLFSCNSQKGMQSDYEVNKNETFEVILKSNPTTGYSWKWVKNQSSKLVDSVSTTYTQDKAESGMVGVGGKEIWKFKGKESGVDTLVFEYARSWEKYAAAETKKVVVRVK